MCSVNYDQLNFVLGWLILQMGLLHGGELCDQEHEPNGGLREGTHNMGQVGGLKPGPSKNPSHIPKHVS